MEILLAIVVASAVIFFGALISMGNERQRKAIDHLQEQLTLWALQDLLIKREKLSQGIKVEKPIEWLNIIATKVSGVATNLKVVEFSDNPMALICISDDGINKVLFSPLSPSEIRIEKHKRKNQLSRYTDHNLLLALPKNVTCYKISALNAGVLFDLELPIVWERLTTQKIEQRESLWMYSIP